MLENARAAEAADRYAESVEKSTKKATKSVNKPARKKPEATEWKRRQIVGNVEENGLTQVVRAREKENIYTVDMTGHILKKPVPGKRQ